MDPIPPPEPPPIPPPGGNDEGRRVTSWCLLMVVLAVPALLFGGVLAAMALDKILPGAQGVVQLSVPAAWIAVIAAAVGSARVGPRRGWNSRKVLRWGWGVAAAGIVAMVAVGLAAFGKVRDSSKLKAMLPRQPAAAIDQFYLEYPYRIFLKYDEIIGPTRYVKSYYSVDESDISRQFPIRQGWSDSLPVRLPDGTTVRRLEVLAAISKGGLVAPYPLPQDDQYDPKRVYRLDCGVSFRDWHVVDLPPDPAGREGRDQDGVHTYQFPDGRRFEITYRGGVPDGPFRAYHADGAPWGEATYRHGRVVEAWLITRDGRKFDELKDGEAAQNAVSDSLIAASQSARDSGRQKLGAKDYAGAIVDLTRALAINPLDADLHRARAGAYRATGNLDGAINDYGAAEGFPPEQLGAYRMPEPLRSLVLARGRQRQQAGDTAGADRDFAAFGKDAGLAAEEMLHNRDFAGAVQRLDPAIAAAPVAELLAARADARRRLPGQQAAAEADYTQALELAGQGKMQLPANQPVLPAHWLYKRGHVRRLLGNLAGAVEDFRAAVPGLGLSAVIQRTDAAFWLFLVQCEQGRKADATAELARTDQSGWMEWNRQYTRFLLGESTEAQLDAYVGSNGNDDIRFRASFFNAMLRRFAGDNAGALVRFQQAFKHSTYDDFARDETRRALVQAARSAGEQKLQARDFTGALAGFEQALHLSEPAPADLLMLFADAKRGQGDLEGALKNYQDALRKTSAETDAPLRQTLKEKIAALEQELEPIRKAKAAAAPNAAPKPQPAAAAAANRPAVNPGMVKFRAGDYAGAIADFTKDIERNPADATGFLLRADARRMLGDLAGAIADYTRVIELTPNTGLTAMAQYHRGHAYWLQGNLAGAMDDFRAGRNAHSSFWLYLVQCKQGQPEEAAPELAARLAAPQSSTWTPVDKKIAGFLAGQITAEDLLHSAEQADRGTLKPVKFQALFYAAMKRRLAGDPPGALALFRQALALPADSSNELEKVEARRAVQELSGEPEKPAAK